MTRRLYFLCIVILVAGLTLFTLLRGVDVNQSTSNKVQPTTFTLQEAPNDVIATSFAHKTSYAVDTQTRILLVPHHLVAGREIASLLTSTPTPKHALLVSPDHFSQGQRTLSTTHHSFTWNDTPIPPNSSLVDALLKKLPATLQIQDSVFEREHGVRGLIPFLHQAWPRAQITAMTVRVDSSNTTIEQLAQTLHTALQQDPDLLIVITIDFSHELPAYLADLHDAYAIQELRALNAEASSLVEIDSPPLFRLLTRLTQLQKSRLITHAQTNSLRVMNATVTELGTSHALMSTMPVHASAMSSQTTTSASSSTTRFTLFHDPARRITSSEDRVYRGYTTVQTTPIPFPTIFVQEQTATTTHWHAIPLHQTKTNTWQVVSDQQYETLKPQRAQWASWAETHLSKPTTE